MKLMAWTWEAVGLRVLVVAVALVIWFWTQKLIGQKAGGGDGIGAGATATGRQDEAKHEQHGENTD